MTISTAAHAGIVRTLEALARTSVLVVGDAMLDRYVFGEVRRISPEAPVPVLAVSRELALPGGAGNVVRNLTALGAAAALVSVVGDDQAGSDLTGLIGGQPNVEPWLLVQGSRCTTVKTRFVADGQQLLRADQEMTAPIHPKLSDRLVRIAGEALAATSIMVISDYAKGVLAGETPARLIAAARAAGRKVVVDPRGPGVGRYAFADVVVLTERSLQAETDMVTANPGQLAAAARWLRTAHGFGAVIVNRRAEGFLAVGPEGDIVVPPGSGDAFDFTGAGDTAVAAVAACLSVGGDLALSVQFAALAMGISATQPGMAVASAGEMLAMMTPEGRARRRVVTVRAAHDQVAHWRRVQLRCGLLTMGPEAALPMDLIGTLRPQCDRLVLGVRGPWEDGVRLAEQAAQAGVDLICVADAFSPEEFARQLNPDVELSA